MEREGYAGLGKERKDARTRSVINYKNVYLLVLL